MMLCDWAEPSEPNGVYSWEGTLRSAQMCSALSTTDTTQSNWLGLTLVPESPLDIKIARALVPDLEPYFILHVMLVAGYSNAGCSSMGRTAYGAGDRKSVV